MEQGYRLMNETRPRLMRGVTGPNGQFWPQVSALQPVGHWALPNNAPIPSRRHPNFLKRWVLAWAFDAVWVRY